MKHPSGRVANGAFVRIAESESMIAVLGIDEPAGMTYSGCTNREQRTPKERIAVQPTSPSREFSAMPDRVLRASPAALSTAGPTGAAAILDPASGKFYSLNEVGARVWSLLNEGTTFGAILEQLQSEYDVTVERLGADVELLLRQFASVGLIDMEAVDDGDI